MPSSAEAGVPPPPLLVCYNFPVWDVLVVIPQGEGASGERERDLFEEACLVPAEDVANMSRILLMQLLPVLVEEDLATYGAAMEAYQRYGFKLFELNMQSPLIAACIEFFRGNGGVGVGMSSWGPALYAFGYDLSHLQSKSEA